MRQFHTIAFNSCRQSSESFGVCAYSESLNLSSITTWKAFHNLSDELNRETATSVKSVYVMVCMDLLSCTPVQFLCSQGQALSIYQAAHLCTSARNSSCSPVGFHLEHYCCSQTNPPRHGLNSLIELNSKRRDDPQGPTQSNSFARRLRRCLVVYRKPRSNVWQCTHVVWLIVWLAFLYAGEFAFPVDP